MKRMRKGKGVQEMGVGKERGLGEGIAGDGGG